MSKVLFRTATENDLVDIFGLAQTSGPGMTTLPNDIKLLNRRIKWSSNSFKKNIDTPQDEYYFFVLEDLTEQKVIGTSAIESYVGFHAPFYSYKILKHTRICPSLDIRNDYELLALVNNYQGSSEICTLYLHPKSRHSGNGLILSRSRFLFMSQFPERFSKTIIAEMRGISDDKGRSPFWNAIGTHFFKMTFMRADRLTLSTNKQFIADLMPRHPVYVNLLPAKAQDVIGKPNQETVPAMKILFREGFHYKEYVDIFDGGPTIEAERDEILTVKHQQTLDVRITSKKMDNHRYIISNTNIDFRATVAHALIEKDKCLIDKETASILKVDAGDKVKIIPLHPKEILQKVNDNGKISKS